MSVPGYQEFMLPLLKLASDGGDHTVRDAMDVLAERMHITPEDRELMLPSGTQTRFYNRVTWATTYLTKSGLLEKSGRGRFKITPRGTEVLAENPPQINNAFLERFPEYRQFKTRRAAAASMTRLEDAAGPALRDAEVTPEEQLEAAYDELREALADDLLKRVRAASPKFFEHLVVRVLTAMGYGRGQAELAEVTGKSGDEGIDGVIREDRLGLDMVYVQAKKWDAPVPGGEIDKFVGSLMRKRARKGVFITSGTFTEGGRRAAKEGAVVIRLIAGDELAELMIDYGVGVSAAETYVVKKVDTDFFEALE